MKKSHLQHFDLDLYQETLPNGLTIHVIPKAGNNIYTNFITKYGSFDNEFIPYQKKRYYKAPMGVAHFLEHKVFEQKDGEDPFTFYTRNGADSNASTSYIRTCYLFSGPNHFEENLTYLLDFVQTPYFTEENVEKEKGIIEQEIKMYEDIPYWKLYERTLYNSFHKHPLKYPIAGTVESISKITKKDLYTCYDTFYHPSNMFLTVVGNVDPSKVMEVVANNQKQKQYKERGEVIRKKIEEPDTVFQEKELVAADIEIPKASVAYKIPVKKYDINRMKVYLDLYFSLRLGPTSLLSERLKKENVITGGIGIDIMEAESHLLCVISIESKKPEYVLEQIDGELKKKEITEEELNRKKKTMKSACIYQSDSVYSLASHINGQLLKFGKIILDEYEWIDSFQIEECQQILKSINFDHKATVILEKK